MLSALYLFTVAAVALSGIALGMTVHPAIPADQQDDPNARRNLADSARPMQCATAFEPTCDMYYYVRYWNKRFYPEDCYQSPLRPSKKLHTPWAEQKYVVFQPDCAGWNNVRMSTETIILFAHATGRTLVLPPRMQVAQMLAYHPDDHRSNFQKYFDFQKISESVNIINMEDFIENVAKPGLLKVPYPAGLSMAQKTDLWKYFESACHMPNWEPYKAYVALNLSAQFPHSIGDYNLKPELDPRLPLMARDRRAIPYDNNMHQHRALYFTGTCGHPQRLLTHFYSYLYWTDPHIDQIYKRIVRDRLHYHDDIFCSAGRLVKLLHETAAVHSYKPMPSPRHADRRTHGGDTNRDATYFAYHIRRDDFSRQYEHAVLPAETIWANTKHLLNTSVSNIIYISTDERNKSFFAPFMQPPFQVRFLRDFADRVFPLRNGSATVNMNHLGMIEQVVCANAHTFIGTPLSTFTGYITRMRGYYRDGRYERTYYTQKENMYQLQKQRAMYQFFGREFETAHKNIDDQT